MRLEGKTAIVTGAASGLGHAMATAFNREGARVVYSDIEDIPEFTPSENAEFIRCDVSDSQSVKALIADAVDRFGSLDIMVNNAGIGSLGSITDTDDDNWKRTIDINLSGVFYGTREAALYMKEHSIKGSIINTSSILGRVGLAGALSYCASKGGVVQVTHAAALDLADLNIRVNAVAPGFIKTQMTEQVREDEAFNSMVVSNTPLGAMGEPDDIANAAVYLASDESRYVTGEILYVDGGWTAR